MTAACIYQLMRAINNFGYKQAIWTAASLMLGSEVQCMMIQDAIPSLARDHAENTPQNVCIQECCFRQTQLMKTSSSLLGLRAIYLHWQTTQYYSCNSTILSYKCTRWACFDRLKSFKLSNHCWSCWKSSTMKVSTMPGWLAMLDTQTSYTDRWLQTSCSKIHQSLDQLHLGSSGWRCHLGVVFYKSHQPSFWQLLTAPQFGCF